MKKFKNKLFYINAFILYLIFMFLASFLTLLLFDSSARNLLINQSTQLYRNGSADTLIVVIDDYSVQKYKWPWVRDQYTDLLNYFYKYANPKVIGLDMVINGYDENNPSHVKFFNQISKMNNLVSSFVPDTVPETDTVLLNTLKKKFSLEVDERNVNFPTYFYSIAKMSQKMAQASNNYGSVKIEPETRFQYVLSAINLIKIGDEFYPSLPLKMYLLSNNTNKIMLDRDYITVPKTGLKIPYESGCLEYIRTNIRYYENRDIGEFSSQYSHGIISASKILDTYKALEAGKTPDYSSGEYINPNLFKNKAVFIGQNVTGPSADVLKTPMNDMHPGVDIQATIFDNLKESYFLHYVGFTASFAIFMLLSIIAFVLVMRCKFIKGLLSILLIDIIFLIFVYLMAYTKGLIFTYSVPLVCQFVTIVFGYSFKFITENRNKEKIKQAMGKYLSQDIMKNVVSNIDDLKLGGKRAVVTVLFSDIRGFTSLSEKMSAEEVSVILNEYFAEMEPIITKYNGVINKFIGDAVMAIFGEPIQDINHPQNAVKCAYEMLKKVEYLREKWLFEGKPKIEIGVGINTGEVFIGNIGTETRMEYTVIGDTVNLASRIESYNKVYKTNLLVSSSTYEHIAGTADVIKISEVQIRGKAKKMNIYEVLRIDLKK